MSIRSFAYWASIILIPFTLVFILHVNDNIVVLVDIVLVLCGFGGTYNSRRPRRAILKVDGYEVEYTYSKEVGGAIFVFVGSAAKKRTVGRFAVAQAPHSVKVQLPDVHIVPTIPASLTLEGRSLCFSMSKQTILTDSRGCIIMYDGLGLFGSEDDWYWSGAITLFIKVSGKRRRRRMKELDEKIRVLFPKPQPAF